jgi:phosphate transport system substrate-binding protein
MQRKTYFFLALLMIGAMLLAACQPKATEAPVVEEQQEEATEVPVVEEEPEEEAEETAEGMLPMVDPLSVTGDIVIAGSSTVYPLGERMAARFKDEGYSGLITIDSIGSGAGFERFCETGETDISNASRPIKDSEVEACREIGRDPIQFRVGTDALAVVVSAENTFVTEATMEELAMIFGSSAETWADVRAEWPDEPILRYIPGTDSGTFDFFVEEVFDKDKTPHLDASNTNLSEDDNVLVKGILGSPYAVGYFGYAYYAENADALTILTIDGIEPTNENVDSFTYPLARPLFMYSDATIMQEKPQVAAFLNFYLTYVNEEIEDVGYFKANEADLGTAMQSWLDAMK